ncbi:periplasmic chaperone for outer membrane proteins Skp [Geothermobacter ehrlichii]|uniref:Periplasmic chaperone for outer membrane proteins Skp n=1 Tax=Geothermobacter ehrlichii TaxID=213224 RepID=A0A5D3WN90_9BACT|nr:OmpH family outer membrane protein [Geothermobacter ehrlichii]TYP00038.1 periplasmic chaperone for outer membrane proteins Skp [Geothermobacter ehrlichii]
MKRCVLLLALLGMVFLGVNGMAADLKIGYVDLQKVLNESDAGKAAKQKIGEKVKEYEIQIQARQKELQAAKEELEKQALLLSDEARSKKEREYQQKLKELQRFTKDVREDLQMRDSDATKKILAEILKIVSSYGEEQGYTLILEKNESSLIYASDKIDLTDAILERYNQSRKK